MSIPELFPEPAAWDRMCERCRDIITERRETQENNFCFSCTQLLIPTRAYMTELTLVIDEDDIYWEYGQWIKICFVCRDIILLNISEVPLEFMCGACHTKKQAFLDQTFYPRANERS